MLMFFKKSSDHKPATRWKFGNRTTRWTNRDAWMSIRLSILFVGSSTGFGDSRKQSKPRSAAVSKGSFEGTHLRRLIETPEHYTNF